MVVWDHLDHFGPVHFPTVPWPLPTFCGTLILLLLLLLLHPLSLHFHVSEGHER